MGNMCRSRQRCVYSSAISGDVKQVKQLLREGVDVNIPFKNEFGHMALHLAVWNDHVEIAKLLIEHNATIDACTATMYARSCSRCGSTAGQERKR